MRSIFLTILLALVAVVTAGLAGLGLSDGELARVFGAPATPIGSPLYDFEPAEVTQMQLSGNGVSAICRKGEYGWEIVSPWRDRMDPRAVEALFGFTLDTRVEGAIPTDKIDAQNRSFKDGLIADGQIGLRFADESDDPLAKFLIGHKTAWVGTDPESGESIPTVFVQPRDRSRKDFLYACTDPDDIHSLLSDGFKRLRDHHPFLFHPTVIESIRIRNKSGEMLLSRKSPKELWSIVKPLGLKSDRQALVALLQGLYDLEAVTVQNRSTVTLPTADPDEVDQIAIRFFGSETETVLEIYPPENPEAKTVLAKISDRPEAIFELPLTTTPASDRAKALTGMNELPLSVNALRDPTLTSIDPRGLQTILISPAVGEDILIRREDPQRSFRIMLDGKLSEPNETALFSLLKAITEWKVAKFISDTATDLAPYGLDQPFLVLRFLSFNGEAIQLDFGQSKDGVIHAIREGTTTVVAIDPAMLALIPTNSWDWRDTRLWKISAVNVSALVRQLDDESPLTLSQNGVTETWTARTETADLTDTLSTVRAEALLLNLLDLQASNWLRPGENAADEALANPDLVISLVAKDYQNGELTIIRPELTIARVKRGNIELCYGRVSTEKSPFLLDPKQVDLLEADLFSDD